MTLNLRNLRNFSANFRIRYNRKLSCLVSRRRKLFLLFMEGGSLFKICQFCWSPIKLMFKFKAWRHSVQVYAETNIFSTLPPRFRPPFIRLSLSLSLSISLFSFSLSPSLSSLPLSFTPLFSFSLHFFFILSVHWIDTVSFLSPFQAFSFLFCSLSLSVCLSVSLCMSLAPLFSFCHST